jgi:hypothetical protein
VSIKSAACAVVMCLASSAALAQPAALPAGPVAGLGPVMPPAEIARVLWARGFVPQATPVRNGEAYQVRAIDRFGRQVRLAIDARYGDILMVRPIAMVPPGAYGPRPYGRPPGYYGYYDDEPPTGAVGAYQPPPGAAPPPGHTATIAPTHPPIPRPKPAAKPAVAAAPATQPTQAAPAPTAAGANPAPATPPASASPANAANAPSAMPPVAPLE